jgi:hypothetical protein
VCDFASWPGRPKAGTKPDKKGVLPSAPGDVGPVICRVPPRVLALVKFPVEVPMSIGWSRAALFAAGALSLLGCAADDANVTYYAPPPGLTPDKGVTILGSKGDTFVLQSQEYRAVWAIDGVLVADPVRRWDHPLLVTANEPHHLKVVFDWGAVAGGTEFDYSGPPGSTVVLQAEDVGRQVTARLWLADAATGRVLGEKQLVPLGYIALAPMPVGPPEGYTVNHIMH